MEVILCVRGKWVILGHGLIQPRLLWPFFKVLHMFIRECLFHINNNFRKKKFKISLLFSSPELKAHKVSL